MSRAGSTAAVHSVEEFVIGVPDLDVARHFYESFGLDVRGEEGGLALYTNGHPHRWARVLGGFAHEKLLWLSFGAYEDDLATLRHQLVNVGALDGVPPNGASPEGIWVRSPDGVPIQVRVAPKCSPSAPGPREHAPATGPGRPAVGRAPARSKVGKVGKVHPLYLSHVLLFASDVDQALEFFGTGLGLRLSDRSGSVIAFMHMPHGSDHHLVALAKSAGPGLHHSSWCVPSIDAVGLGMEQMKAVGYAEGWGVGRHVLGSKYFHYVRDPWGSYAEYSFDIDFVPAGTTWPAADHPGEDSLYVWGPSVPEEFVVNTEIGDWPASAMGRGGSPLP